MEIKKVTKLGIGTVGIENDAKGRGGKWNVKTLFAVIYNAYASH